MSAQPENKQVVKPVLETYFSEYGYVIVNKNDLGTEEPLILCEGKNVKFYGKIQKANLKEKITVSLKTFYGKRTTYSFELGINEKLSKIVQYLIEAENEEKDPKMKFTYNSQYRLISTSGKIKELNINKSLVDQNIKNNQILIILEQKKIRWSEIFRGPGIFLEHRNKRAVKTGEEFQMVLTERGFNSGKHYVEMTLETVPDEMSIVVGVSLKRSDFYINLTDFRGFWGYILSSNKAAKKISYTNKVEQVNYGEICKINDKVGILMEFNDSGLDISFFVNKINMGVAFKSLPVDFYFPCCVLYFDGSKVKLESSVPFPDI